jgi:DNA-binding MarR family transcriptional regulator
VPLIMRVVSAELRRTGHGLVPAHLGVLFLLSQSSCNLSELAEHQAVSLPTMSNTVSTMVQEGWIKRTRAAHDRRMLLIEITPAGQTVLADISAQVIDHIAKILAPLATKELATLQSGLAILQRSFFHGSNLL